MKYCGAFCTALVWGWVSCLVVFLGGSCVPLLLLFCKMEHAVKAYKLLPSFHSLLFPAAYTTVKVTVPGSCTARQAIFLRACLSSRVPAQHCQSKCQPKRVPTFVMACSSTLLRHGARLTPGMQAAALGSSVGLALAGGALTGQ